MDIRTIAFSLAAAAIAATASAQPTAQIIPLDLTGSRPAVSVSIGGAPPELWVFDTGAMGAAINMDRARALNLPEEQPVQLGSPAGGTPMQGFFTTLSNARVGDVALAPFQIVAAPSLVPGRGGVMSPAVFSGKLLTLDFAQSQLRITDKSPATLPRGPATPYEGARAGHALPSISITINGQTLHGHIDTGSPGALILPYAMAASLPLAAPAVQVGVAHFVDGVHPRYSATLNGDVQVGPLTLHNPEIGFIDGLPTLNVGTQLLTQMTIVLDPAEQRSWALASPNAPESGH